MDFAHRATPHPQTMSPLQQWVAEELQAKEDPINDEVEGLETEVLLNTNVLEESKPVPLDFKGQEELLPTLLPPSHNSHPPTLQHSPPASVQLPTSIIDPVQQLVQALLSISQNTAAPPSPPHHPTISQSQVQAPDTFNGSNLRDCEHSCCSARSLSTLTHINT